MIVSKKSILQYTHLVSTCYIYRYMTNYAAIYIFVKSLFYYIITIKNFLINKLFFLDMSSDFNNIKFTHTDMKGLQQSTYKVGDFIKFKIEANPLNSYTAPIVQRCWATSDGVVNKYTLISNRFVNYTNIMQIAVRRIRYVSTLFEGIFYGKEICSFWDFCQKNLQMHFQKNID